MSWNERKSLVFFLMFLDFDGLSHRKGWSCHTRYQSVWCGMPGWKDWFLTLYLLSFRQGFTMSSSELRLLEVVWFCPCGSWNGYASFGGSFVFVLEMEDESEGSDKVVNVRFQSCYVDIQLSHCKGPCGSFVECKTSFDPNFAKPSSRHRVDQFGSKWICK